VLLPLKIYFVMAGADLDPGILEGCANLLDEIDSAFHISK